MTHTINVTLQLLVSVDGYILYKVLVRMYIVKQMVTSILGILSFLYKISEHLLLKCQSFGILFHQLSLS